MKKYYMVTFLTLAICLPAMALAGGDYGSAKDKMGAMNKKDIIDTARSAGMFNTLVKAISAADLTATLKSDGPFTVFAPTDAAFAKLPAGTVANLLKPENKADLQALLTYHVVSGKVMAADAQKLTSAKTVNGNSFRIRQSGKGLMVDDAMVTKADIGTSNGVIHVIDSVIMP